MARRTRRLKPGPRRLDAMLNELRERYASQRHAIRARLAEFAAVPSSEYFYELAYCLLTPQSSARNADAVVSSLRAGDFRGTGFDPEPTLHSREHYVRFHRTKSRRLHELRAGWSDLEALLAEPAEAGILRDLLVTNVKGLGLKEATHFLRNVGRNGGLAILDRHILRNLRRFGAIRRIPATLTRKQYLSVERSFQRFADRIAIPVDELDLLFWSMETGEIRK